MNSYRNKGCYSLRTKCPLKAYLLKGSIFSLIHLEGGENVERRDLLRSPRSVGHAFEMNTSILGLPLHLHCSSAAMR